MQGHKGSDKSQQDPEANEIGTDQLIMSSAAHTAC